MSTETQETGSSDSPPPKKNLPRVLIGVLIVVAVGVGVRFVLQRQAAAAEQAAAQQLKAMGAVISPNAAGQPSSLALFIPGRDIDLEKALQLATKLIHLKSVNASNSTISDEQLQYVGQIKSLIDLQLSHTSITDGGMKQLTGLRRLESLYVSNTAVTSTCLAEIGKLRSLKVLGIDRTKISGGFEPLTKLGDLTLLLASGLEISDEDADTLSRIPNLRRLNVHGSTVSEKGLEVMRTTIEAVDL